MRVSVTIYAIRGLPGASASKSCCAGREHPGDWRPPALGEVASGFLLQRKTAQWLARFAITPNCLARQPGRLIHGNLI